LEGIESWNSNWKKSQKKFQPEEIPARRNSSQKKFQPEEIAEGIPTGRNRRRNPNWKKLRNSNWKKS